MGEGENGAHDRFLPSGCEREVVIASGEDIEVVFPEGVNASALMDATKSEDVLGAWCGPEHAGLFAARTDYGFASCLDHAGTDEEAPAAKAAVTHAFFVAFEVAQSLFDGLGIGMCGGNAPRLGDDAFDAVSEE